MKFLFAASVLANIAVLLWALYSAIVADPELANKQEWSILQIVESQYRDTSSEPDVKLMKNLEDTGYDAVGIYDVKTSKRFWILTNSKISPRIKLMPEVAEFTLSERQVEMILAGLNVNNEVKSFLSTKRY